MLNLSASEVRHWKLAEWYLKQKHSVDMSLVTLTGGKTMTIDVPISNLTKILGPNWQNEWTCRHCHKRMCKMSKCKDCDAHYCGLACQRADWPTHKSLCRAISTIFPPDIARRRKRFWRTQFGGLHFVNAYYFSLYEHLVATRYQGA